MPCGVVSSIRLRLHSKKTKITNRMQYALRLLGKNFVQDLDITSDLILCAPLLAIQS